MIQRPFARRVARYTGINGILRFVKPCYGIRLLGNIAVYRQPVCQTANVIINAYSNAILILVSLVL